MKETRYTCNLCTVEITPEAPPGVRGYGLLWVGCNPVSLQVELAKAERHLCQTCLEGLLIAASPMPER